MVRETDFTPVAIEEVTFVESQSKSSRVVGLKAWAWLGSLQLHGPAKGVVEVLALYEDFLQWGQTEDAEIVGARFPHSWIVRAMRVAAAGGTVTSILKKEQLKICLKI